MVSLKDPKTWIPHPKDCSKKICKLYCTKWCRYIIVPSPPPPPPPPPPPVSKDDLGGSTLSHAVIVIISLIGSFFLLIGFYVIVSCYCLRNNESSVLLSRRVETHETRDPESGMDDEDEDQEDDNSDYVPWLILGKGLDEGLIKSITICKYKKGNGLVSCTDCSICLGEFQEDESLRLLPKCVHAFHIYCIDTWLKTHLNCPLCRANVCFEVKDSLPISQPPPPPSPLATTSEL